jgi:IS66 Orf2 like protein
MTEKARSALPAKLWPWHKHVCACQASGQTMVAYAKAHRLSVQAFYRAKGRLALRRGSTAAAWVFVPARRRGIGFSSPLELSRAPPERGGRGTRGGGSGTRESAAGGGRVVMMRPAPDLPVVYLCREAVDFRKGLYALAVLVESQLKLDPFSARLFAFRNRRATAVKVLYWERAGRFRNALSGLFYGQLRIYIPRAAFRPSKGTAGVTPAAPSQAPARASGVTGGTQAWAVPLAA